MIIKTIPRAVEIPAGNVRLKANLSIPTPAKGLVIFAHGSGSGRDSLRNNLVAASMYKVGFGTLLPDLLTEAEDETPGNRFDIELLTKRLLTVTGWLLEQEGLADLPLGYFGASTGAASAIRAAAALNRIVKAVVSRGGRPDLAADRLADVRAPVLLIVGELDKAVLELNRNACDRLRCRKKLTVVSGATHLFAERGKLEEVTRLAAAWFRKYLPPD